MELALFIGNVKMNNDHQQMNERNNDTNVKQLKFERANEKNEKQMHMKIYVLTDGDGELVHVS
jgi:hypothetical protein